MPNHKPPVTDGETITRHLYNTADEDREMSREARRAATRMLLVKALRADGTVQPNDVVIDTGECD